MNSRLLLFLFLIFLFSCGEEKRQVFSEEKNQHHHHELVSDSAKARLLQIVQGGWINETYLAALNEYRSPMDAARFGWPAQQIAFDRSGLRGDTLYNPAGLKHCSSGRRFDLVFYPKEDGRTGMYIEDGENERGQSAELNYEIRDADTILLLTVRGEHAQTLRFRREFHDFTEEDGVVLTAIELHINRNFFAGEWKNENQQTAFSEYGSVRNFSGYKRYAVSFTDDHPQSQPDKITFYNDTVGKTFVYTTKDGNLKFYELFESKDGRVMERGDLVCVFRK